MRRERENRERRLKKGEEEARERNSHYRKNPKRVGPPPPLFTSIMSILVHSAKYKVPCCGFHIYPIVLIEAADWARITMRLSYFEVL